MKSREVRFAPEAETDLALIYDQIADAASSNVAFAFIERVRTYCFGFELAGERGQRRDDVRRGLRIVGFERTLTFAFTVDDQAVTFLRVFYAGRDWEREL